MTWSRFDDGYDEHEKVEEAWFAHPPNPVGLHAMATTACNRWSSDGVIRPRWIEQKLPQARARRSVLATCIDVELFDFLTAGEQFTATDSDGNTITHGPFVEDRYIVHDFLDRHDSSVQVKERRRRDAERKALSRKNTGPVRPDSDGTPPGRPQDSDGSPRASRGRGRASAQALPDPTRPNSNPPNPQGGVPTSDLDSARERLRLAAPPRPSSRRQRDVTHWEEQLSAWGAEHFPAAPLSGLQLVVSEIRGRGIDPTPDAIREFVAKRPTWALTLEPAA